jgi:ketosteroid isomerase-like protein
MRFRWHRKEYFQEGRPSKKGMQKRCSSSGIATIMSGKVGKIQQVIAVGNEVCSVGEWSCNAQDSDGKTKQLNGYFLTVFGREGDTWKTRISTFNLVPPTETK